MSKHIIDNEKEEKVWELAHIISLMTCTEKGNVFGRTTTSGIFSKYSYREALDKYEKYQKVYSFEVGDKIYCKENDCYGVVTYSPNEFEFNVIWDDGSVDRICRADIIYDKIKNTGEKIDIVKLLKEIKGDKI